MTKTLVGESFQDRITNIFVEAGKPLSGETVVLTYREQYADSGTSDSIRTAISALTRQGALQEIGTVRSVLTGRMVMTWGINTGSVTPAVTHSKQSPKQFQAEIDLLKAEKKHLEETNMKLYGIIEELRKGK